MGALLILGVIVLSVVPPYVIGQRSGVEKAWVAFIPLVGTTIVLLWSIRSPGWWAILGLIPIVNIFFVLWLVFALPRGHHRSGWWGLALLVPLIGMCAYAFTLTPRQYALAHWTA